MDCVVLQYLLLKKSTYKWIHAIQAHYIQGQLYMPLQVSFFFLILFLVVAFTFLFKAGPLTFLERPV